MKKFFLILFLQIAKAVMKVIYFFIKLFTKQKCKVTMLSRQANEMNLDFRLIKDELEKSNSFDDKITIQVLCKKIPKSCWGRIRHCFYIVKCMYHIATSKVCIVDGYNIPISVLKHKKGTEIIQIWHAMGAIKKFGYQCLDKKEGTSSTVAKIMKMHANYSCITCTSNATREIYSEAFNTDIQKIKVLGMPRIDYILGKNNKIQDKIEKLLKAYPMLGKKKNILYVPTFRRRETIDIGKLIEAVDKEKFNLIIRLHPLDHTKISKENEVSDKYSTYDLLKIADFVITDYSAVAFEAATLNKPIFFYIFDIQKYEGKRGLNIDLFEEMKNCTSTDIKEIMKIITEESYDYEELEKFRNKYVETTDINNSKRISDYIIDALKKG